jgi:hypothetical protein
MRRMIAPLALALALTTGCGGSLSNNQKQGLGVVGGFAVVMGGTLIVDGMSCDEETWSGADCGSYDGAELRNGGLMVAGGAALLTWAIVMLSQDDPAPEPSGTRTAKNASK